MKIISEKHILADDGKALCRKDDHAPSTITEVYLSNSDSIDNWTDCEYNNDELN